MRLLREVRRIIKDNGLLVVSVPTIPFYLRLIRSKWRMFIGDHYWFFGDTSMGRLMNKAGFEIIKSHFVSKSVDLDTISARLADEWQPNNLGRVGKFLRKVILKVGVERIRFPVNLFDSKIYFAIPGRNK